MLKWNLLTVWFFLTASVILGAAAYPSPTQVCKGVLPDASVMYNLPPWITTLNWVTPADTVYGGTQYVHTAIPSNSRDLPPALPNAKSPGQYCEWLRVQGGTPPYKYSVTGSNTATGVTGLPIGLSLQQVGNAALFGGNIQQTNTRYLLTFCVSDATGTTQCLSPRRLRICARAWVRCTIGP